MDAHPAHANDTSVNSPAPVVPMLRAVLLCDIVESTALVERLGDRERVLRAVWPVGCAGHRRLLFHAGALTAMQKQRRAADRAREGPSDGAQETLWRFSS